MTKEKLENVICNYCGADNYTTRYEKEGYNIVQCNQCGLVYVNPRLIQNDIFELYDENYFHGKGFDKSIEYKDEFENNKNKTNLLDWDVSSIKENLKSNSPKPLLLDAGCGMGLFLYKAKIAGFECEGIELSPYAAKFVESVGFTVQNASLENAEMPEGKYDAIVMREVIEHLADPKTILKKVYNALKPGGVLFMTTGNYDCPERKVRGKDWFYFMPEGHIYIFSNKTMNNYLKETGFSKIEVTNQGDLLMNILLNKNLIETDKFKPKNSIKRIGFETVRAVNHFISSGLRIYAVK